MEEYKCASCGIMFKGRYDRAEHNNQFCTKKCHVNYAPMQETRKCAECGKDFEINKHRPDKTCGLECRNAHFIREKSHSWKGGLVLLSDRPSRRIDREGYVGGYEGEHRLIAARVIGRPLVRGECIICLDGDNLNMAPENMFLCPNKSEIGLIQAGTVEWPTASNLTDYRVSNYVRPSVILTLHEWTDGKRRTSGMGRPITRHPQADEIIKRRKAGASLRTLAAEFDYSMSTMSKTLRTRL